MSAKAILKADSAVRKGELEAAAGTWDGEMIEVSKYAADLKQLDNGKKIPPKGWKCECCDLTSNLWLNLTDGSILCGRKVHALFFVGDTVKLRLCLSLCENYNQSPTIRA